jgi:DNA polymerase-1
VRVHFVGRRGKDALVYDEAAVLARFGVPPLVLPSYVALTGDASDNLPGVPGIGASTAQKLLAGKTSCEELFADLAAVKSAKTREILLAHRDQIRHTESLARLREDAPLPEDGPHWGVPTPSALGALGGVFQELEFKSLLTRLQALLP